MECPHCSKHFHEQWTHHTLNGGWSAFQTSCAACDKVIILIRPPSGNVHKAYPAGSPGRQPTVTKYVPADIGSDYEEACSVLAYSAKAAAALARRCLQEILRSQGYQQRDLVEQIKAVLNEKDPSKSLPQSLYDTVDAVRNFGNFSAHPMNDKTSLQVIDVDPEEAEWCLEIVEELFEHYYNKPAILAQRKAALNEKLKAAGKPMAL